jgi:Zn-dependent protease
LNTANFLNALITLASLLVAVVVHEYSHGRMAELMGDPTARNAGRLTLNPIAHIDPVGTIILPGVLLIINLINPGGGFVIGWAKPVPINPMFFRNKRQGLFWVGLAGVAANLAMAFSAGIVLSLTYSYAFMVTVLMPFIWINCLLAVFNLIPIPPLDGSRLVEALIPRNWVQGYTSIEPYGIFIIFGLFFIVPGFFSSTIQPVTEFLARMFISWPQLLAAALGF